jgi:hypothetical protein
VGGACWGWAKWVWTHMKAAFPTGKEILDTIIALNTFIR